MFIFSIIVYSIFVFILFYKIQYKNNDVEEIYFRDYNSLRGFFALEIVIGHVIRYEATPLYPLGKFMIISVAYFFFVSAWGGNKSFHNKEHYLKRFIINKCGYLFILSLFAFIIRMFVSFIDRSFNYDTNIIEKYFRTTNWYIWELIFFYLLFYFTYKYISKYRIFIITIITFIFITCCFFLEMPQGWYCSALAYPAGLFFYEYYDKIIEFSKKIKAKIIVAIMTILGGTSLFLPSDSLIGMVYLRNIMCIAALCILFYFLKYFHPDNKLLKLLGKYSTEIYLYQFAFLSINAISAFEWYIRIILVVGATFLTALIMHPVHVVTRKILSNSKNC